jgi:hypothetical protein
MNRRDRTRFKTDLTVKVSCSDLKNGSCKARLADLSVHGLSLIIDEMLPVSASVKVEWGSVTFVGELVYCQSRGHEYLLGLKVEDSVYETARKYSSQQNLH